MSIKRVFRQAVSFIMTFLMLLSYIPLSAEAAGTMSMKVKIDGTTYYDEEDCGEFDLNEDSYASIKLTYKNVGYATIQIHEAAGNTIGMRSDVGVINGTSTSTRQTKTVKVPFVANVADSGYTVNKELPVGDYAFWIFYKDKQSDSTAERILVYFSLVKNSSGSITLSKSSISLNWGGSNEDSFTVSGVSSYNVAIDSTGSQWLKYEKSGKTVTVRTRRANYSTSTRTATVTVTSGSNSKTVKVTQKACGEAAPTIVAKTGPSLSSLTTIPSGSNIGSYGTTGTDTFWLYAQVNHVRRITVNIKSKTTGEPYLSQTFDSSDGLDGSSQTVKCFTPVHQTGGAPLPVGKYYFEIWASNSPEKNDLWSQHPDCWVVYFDVIGEGGDKPTTLEEAENMVIFSYNKKPKEIEVGRVRHIPQVSTDPYYCKDYWISGAYDTSANSGHLCTRAAYSMALSYIGVDCTPGRMASLMKTSGDIDTVYYDNVTKKLQGYYPGLSLSKRSSSLSDLYENYLNDASYSPVYVRFDKKGTSVGHSVIVIGRSTTNPNEYYCVDPDFGTKNNKTIHVMTMVVNDNENYAEEYTFQSCRGRSIVCYYQWHNDDMGEAVDRATITYNANGGSNAPSSTTATCNTTVTLSTKVPTRSGYIFLGWSTNRNATVASYKAGASYKLTGDVTLYAVWEKEQSTEDFIAGDINMDGNVNKDDAVYLAGYIMLGWIDNLEYPGTVDYNKDGKVTKEDAILLAGYIMLGWSIPRN